MRFRWGVKYLNTQSLRYVVEVERTGSISSAAEKLYMSQPHLSKMIRELEETLNVVIFKRTPKGMAPTKKGLEFLAYAKSILAQVDMMENLVGKTDNSKKMTLNAVVPRASYIAYAFTEFVKTLPVDRTLRIDYRETNSVRAIRDVTDGENDLGIIRFPVKYENYFVDFLEEKRLDFESISRFEYFVLFSKNHPLAGDKPLSLSKLEKYIEIVHGDTNIPALPKNKRFSGGKTNRKEIAVYERSSQLELLSRIPLTYMWVSPMPEVVLSPFGLVQRRCDTPTDCYKDTLIYRNGYHFTDEDMGFIAQLKNVVKEISFFQSE
jgi:DNA-binding transcriptional LysR family regulator